MRWLVRIFLHVATAISLICCVTVAVLWVRSYRSAEQAYASQWRVEGDQIVESAWWVLSDLGRIGVAHRDQNLPATANSLRQLRSLIDNPEYSRRSRSAGDLLGSSPQFGPFGRLGFTYLDERPLVPGGNGGYRQWTAPAWFVCVVAGALPAWRLYRLIRRRRVRPGQCPGCGYDLRATPARCPECGRTCGGVSVGS